LVEELRDWERGNREGEEIVNNLDSGEEEELDFHYK